LIAVREPCVLTVDQVAGEIDRRTRWGGG